MAVLSMMTQLMSIGSLWSQCIPPPASTAVFCVIVQPLIVGLPPCSLPMPPPLLAAVFSLIVQPVIVGLLLHWQ